MGETTQGERDRILTVGCNPSGRDMRRLARDVNLYADRIAAIEARVRKLADSIGDSIVMDGDPIEARANDVRAEIEERLCAILDPDQEPSEEESDD